MESITVNVDSSKTEEAVDEALDIVLGLSHQRLLLNEMKANPITLEHRRAVIIEYQRSDTDGD